MENIRIKGRSINSGLEIRYNKHALFLGLIVFLNLSGFYMLSGPPVDPTDIAVVLEIVYIVYILLTRRGRCEYRYKWAMLMPIFFVLVSSIMANYSYGQPLWFGIRAQRTWLFACLMYFPIVKAMKRGEINVRTIFAMLDVVNVIYVLLVIMQYILGDSVRFMVVMSNERYGSTRLYVSLSFVLISYFVHLMRLLQVRKLVFSDLFFIVVTLFLNLSVVKGRMSIVCLLIGTGLAVLSIRFTIRKLFFVGVLFAAAIAFLTSEVGGDILTMIFNSEESIGGDTSGIRDIGREFFITQTLSDWKTALFGCGFANIDWHQTVIAIRYSEGIYANDNGMFGIFFYYGFSFVIWNFLFYVRLMIDAWRRNRAMFFLLLSDLIKIYTLFPLSYTTNIAFAIVCAVLEGTESGDEKSRGFQIGKKRYRIGL